MKLSVITVLMTLSLTTANNQHLARTTDVTRNSYPSRTMTRLVVSRRRRQAQPLTDEDKTFIVDLHNEYRANEGASNMELMTWNDSIATMAERWAAKCLWRHPKKDQDSEYLEYDELGQNLYATTGVKNLTGGMEAWYIEKSDYVYDTRHCPSDKMCGHYTQIVWATSHTVGCAQHTCTQLEGLDWEEPSWYFVCQYWPAGNIVGKKPFLKGPACSNCSSGAGWCKDKLCNKMCSTVGEDCPWKSCAAHCYNCATLNDETCRCECADGWHGADCTQRCEDRHKYCAANPGWPTEWCSRADKPSVRRKCPAMCKECTRDPNAVEAQCPIKAGPSAEEPPSLQLAPPAAASLPPPPNATAGFTSQPATVLVLALLVICLSLTGP